MEIQIKIMMSSSNLTFQQQQPHHCLFKMPQFLLNPNFSLFSKSEFWVDDVVVELMTKF